jgi:hypothetical protein
MQGDVVRCAFEQFGHQALGEPNGFPLEKDFNPVALGLMAENQKLGGAVADMVFFRAAHALFLKNTRLMAALEDRLILPPPQFRKKTRLELQSEHARQSNFKLCHHHPKAPVFCSVHVLKIPEHTIFHLHLPYDK